MERSFLQLWQFFELYIAGLENLCIQLEPEVTRRISQIDHVMANQFHRVWNQQDITVCSYGKEDIGDPEGEIFEPRQVETHLWDHNKNQEYQYECYSTL